MMTKFYVYHLPLSSTICVWSLSIMYGLFSLQASAETQMKIKESAIENLKILPSTAQAKEISLHEACTQALKNNSQLKIVKKQLEQKKMQWISSIGTVLPKIYIGSSYTRNIPEATSSLIKDPSSQAALYRPVAKLLRNAGDEEEADNLEKQADLLYARPTDHKIVINPKDVFSSKLTIEVPIFHGPNFSQIFVSKEHINLYVSKLKSEEAKTIYLTTKAYYLAYYLKNILSLKEQAQETAKERFLKVKAQKKYGLIMEKDFLLLNADYLQAQADSLEALNEYRSSIGELGLLLGVTEEFTITEPHDFVTTMAHMDTASLIELALKHRQDLIAQQHAIFMTKQQEFTSFMSFLPSLHLQGDINYTSNNKGLIDEPFTYALSINARLSLFEGGSRFFTLRERTLKKQEEEIKFRLLQREISANIRGRKQKLEHLNLQVKAHEAAVMATKEADLVIQEQYKKGLVQQEQLLDSNGKYLRALIAFKKSQSDFIKEKLALIYETGLLTPYLIRSIF